MKTQNTQKPNPELHNTAIYVGDNAELRARAIEYYEKEGYAGDDYKNNLPYIGAVGKIFSDFPSEKPFKIITLPERKGIIQFIEDGDYIYSMTLSGVPKYTANPKKAKVFNSFEDALKLFTANSEERNKELFRFIPLSDVEEHIPVVKPEIKPMTSERIQEIQSKTAYPDSISVQQALLKVWNECSAYYETKTNTLDAEIQ
jgi:hypothetical protein